MSKKHITITSICLVFLLLACRVGFDVVGAHHPVATAGTPGVARVVNLPEAEVSSWRSHLTGALLPVKDLASARDLANVYRLAPVLASPTVVMPKRLAGGDLLPLRVSGNVQQKVMRLGDASVVDYFAPRVESAATA